jgi:hypothetical protein
MTWKVMDILNMTYEPETFDVVLEKGSLDALMVHERDPWNISTETEKFYRKSLISGNIFWFFCPPLRST